MPSGQELILAESVQRVLTMRSFGRYTMDMYTSTYVHPHHQSTYDLRSAGLSRYFIVTVVTDVDVWILRLNLTLLNVGCTDCVCVNVWKSDKFSLLLVSVIIYNSVTLSSKRYTVNCMTTTGLRVEGRGGGEEERI
jgi:hypothetical protein